MVCSFIKKKKHFAYYTLNSFFSTCVAGQWSCTQVDCSHTCSILRNTHYTTFSGQYLKVNGGSCQYIAAQYQHHSETFRLILNNNISSEYHHMLQSHLTIGGILFRIFVFK